MEISLVNSKYDDIVQYGYEQPEQYTDEYDWSPDDLDSDDYMD